MMLTRKKFSLYLSGITMISVPKILNENGSNRISSKVFTHSFSGFSNYIKNAIIDTYIMHCNVINCVSCSKFAN